MHEHGFCVFLIQSVGSFQYVYYAVGGLSSLIQPISLPQIRKAGVHFWQKILLAF